MNSKRKLAGPLLYVAGILASLVTFVAGALPAKWGIVLIAACFIVGSVFWPGWDEQDDRSAR